MINLNLTGHDFDGVAGSNEPNRSVSHLVIHAASFIPIYVTMAIERASLDSCVASQNAEIPLPSYLSGL